MRKTKPRKRKPSAIDKDLSLGELEARLTFFPQLRDIFARELPSQRTRMEIPSLPLLGWLAKFGERQYARDMVFGIERALTGLANVSGYHELSSGLKASGQKFWSTLGHLSLAAFFHQAGWQVEVECQAAVAQGTGPLDLLVRWRGGKLGIEVKSLRDTDSRWTRQEIELYYFDMPKVREGLRKYPELEPVRVPNMEELVRRIASRASKVAAMTGGIPRVLALDCTDTQVDAILGEALARTGQFGLDAVATFSIGGVDLYPETRRIVKETPWLQTSLGKAFHLTWEGAESRKAILKRESDRITALLRDEYDPEAIMLFGSFAENRVRENSDLDMVIIKRTEKPHDQRISEVLALAKPAVPLDIFVYTPEEFERLKKQEDFFITQEVLPTCRRVYERPQTVA